MPAGGAPYCPSMRIERDELASAAAGFSGSFFLLASVSVLRPIRDQAGIAKGVAALPGMFAARFLAVAAAAVLVAWIAARVPRSRYIPLTYRIFAAGLGAVCRSPPALRRPPSKPPAFRRPAPRI